MTPPVVECTGIHRTFEVDGQTVPVLKGVDLTIHSRDRIVLFGPSGCGKTTLLHLLALLDTPDKGTQTLKGEDTVSATEDLRAALRASEIGLVFQTFHLLPHHTVLENIRLRTRYLQNTGQIPGDREQDVLKEVGLEEHAHRPARLLSGGEQQRVCIARALLHQPSLFLADEPTGNLDQENSVKVRDLFMKVAEQAPVVVATHDRSWLSFATRVVQFRDGVLIEDSPAFPQEEQV